MTESKIAYYEGSLRPVIEYEGENTEMFSIIDGYTNWLDTSSGITRVKLDAVESIIIEDRVEKYDPYTVSIHTTSSAYTVRFDSAREAEAWGRWFASTVASHQNKNNILRTMEKLTLHN